MKLHFFILFEGGEQEIILLYCLLPNGGGKIYSNNGIFPWLESSGIKFW